MYARVKVRWSTGFTSTVKIPLIGNGATLEQCFSKAYPSSKGEVLSIVGLSKK